MTPDLLAQIGGGIGLVVATAVAAFRVGTRRANGSSSGSNVAPRWHADDRELIRQLIHESDEAMRDHLDQNTVALNEVRSAVDRMAGFLEGRLSGGD